MTSRWPKESNINYSWIGAGKEDLIEMQAEERGWNKAISQCREAIEGITEEEIAKIIAMEIGEIISEKCINDIVAAVKRLIEERMK